MVIDDIVVRKVILHILDTDRGNLVLSNELLETGPDLNDFIRGQLFKIFTDDNAKECVFNEQTSPVYGTLSDMKEKEEDSFIEASKDIATKLYNAMGEGTDIPAADLLYVSFQAEGQIYLGLLKLNYKESFTHEVIDKAGKENTGITRANTIFAASAAKTEAAVISLEDYSIRLLEKKFEVNGEKIFYLSERFLVCQTAMPVKKKFSVLTKTINSILDKYEPDLKVRMDARSDLQKEYNDKESFDIEAIGGKLFGNNAEEKENFDEKMESYDLQFDNFKVVNESTVSKLNKLVLVTDNGIQITVPMEVYNKKADFETKTDKSTGKTTITISNIESITLK